MQSASSRIWTRVAMSIFNDDNHYSTVISTNLNEYLNVFTKPLRHNRKVIQDGFYA